jgi:hypothetical protein
MTIGFGVLATEKGKSNAKPIVATIAPSSMVLALSPKNGGA